MGILHRHVEQREKAGRVGPSVGARVTSLPVTFSRILWASSARHLEVALEQLADGEVGVALP